MAEAPLTIKSNLDYPSASKYKEALRTAGVSCQIARIETNDIDVLPPPLVSAGRHPQAGNATTAGTHAK